MYSPRPAGFWRLGSLGLTAMLIGCSSPEWEESHRVRLDGSGESVLLLEPRLLPPDSGPPVERIRELLSGPGLEVRRTRMRSDGRVEGRLAFDSLAELCRAPLLDRECGYSRVPGGGFRIELQVLPFQEAAKGPGTARIEVRPEARITAHDSGGPIHRGNRLRWSLLREAAPTKGWTLSVTTTGESVLGATVRTVLRAALIAGGMVVVGLTLLFFEGRRRLRRAPAPQ